MISLASEASIRAITFKVFLALLVIFSPRIAFASVLISEVMYNPKGNDNNFEWLELFNDSENEIDLTGWKIFDGSNHRIEPPPKNGGVSDLILGPKERMIIADDAWQFVADHSPIGGSVADSSLSLGNDREVLRLIRSDGGEEDALVYTSRLGGNGDGRSLERLKSSLAPRPSQELGGTPFLAPTPPSQNQTYTRSDLKLAGALIRPDTSFEGETELVSLKNVAGRTLSLDGICLRDAVGSVTRHCFVDQKLEAGEEKSYPAKDMGIALNDSAEMVLLENLDGGIIDASPIIVQASLGKNYRFD